MKRIVRSVSEISMCQTNKNRRKQKVSVRSPVRSSESIRFEISGYRYLILEKTSNLCFVPILRSSKINSICCVLSIKFLSWLLFAKRDSFRCKLCSLFVFNIYACYYLIEFSQFIVYILFFTIYQILDAVIFVATHKNGSVPLISIHFCFSHSRVKCSHGLGG